MRKLAAVVSRVIDGKFVKSDEWTLKDIGIRVGGLYSPDIGKE